MKAIVTGGAGFIGSNLALRLQAEGARVLVIDNFSSGDFHNLTEFRGDLLAQDIRQVDWDHLDPVDIVFHQAALTDTTCQDQREMVSNQVEGMRGALRFAVNHRAPFIYASSAAVYGNLPAPQREAGRLSPLNVYAFSKILCDQLAQSTARETHLPVIGLRYFNVYGIGEQYKAKAASMIYQLAEQMRAGRRPRIFFNGEQMRDHIDVRDVVDLNLRAFEVRTSGVVNVGTGVATTFNRLAEILNEVMGTLLEPDYFENPYPFYQNNTQADLARLKRVFGFEPRVRIEEGIRDYLTSLYQLSPSTPVPSRP